MNSKATTDRAWGWNHVWTPEQRLEIARRHLMAAARQYDERGAMESHKALMIACDQIDHAAESAK